MNGGDMSEAKDLAIKLFGRTIPLPENQIPAKSGAACQIPDKSELMDACSEITKAEGEALHAENSGKPNKSSFFENVKEERQTPIQVNEARLNPKAETHSAGQEKVLKKPDKILPCPRCNSLDTKFCYFNNYNVNQPRHFCKKCQRYWTAGGTMRNVPVGAGRRKNKHLASQYHQIMASSDGVPTTMLEAPDLASHQLLTCGESSTSFRPSTGNGMVLKFGQEAPLCESIETVLNLGDQKRSVNCGENGEEPSSCGSSMTTSSFRENELPEKVMQKAQGTPPHPLNCYPVPPWVFPCNPGWNNPNPESTNPNPVQWCPTPMVAVPGFCTPSIPLQFVPASYWGCMPVWQAGTGSNVCQSPSSSTSNSCCSGNGSPTLGKHSRDANSMEEERSEKCILVPKTLRFDHPDEASKSSIWATLGIRPDQKDPLSKGDIFRAFEPKAKGKGLVTDTAQILEANPAALSRSQTFQEST